MGALFGLLGLLLLLVGVVGLVLAVVPWLRRRYRRWVRGALLITISGVVLLVVGVVLDDEAAPVQPQRASTAAVAPESVAARTPATPVAPATAAPATAKPEPTPSFHEAGTALKIDTWVMQAGWEGQGVVLRRALGDQFLGEQADAGYSFALIPVAVKNDTKRTDSLGFVTWILHDEEGYEYSIEPLADLYLGDNQLDVTAIPPEATRSGYLVFQVREAVSELFLTFDGVRNQQTWRFVIK